MPRYNVNYNGRWACFSSVCNRFITKFMDRDGYETWRQIEYGIVSYIPAEQCNLIPIEQAVSIIRMYSSYDEALEELLGCGLKEDECKQLLKERGCVEGGRKAVNEIEKALFECEHWIANSMWHMSTDTIKTIVSALKQMQEQNKPIDAQTFNKMRGEAVWCEPFESPELRPGWYIINDRGIAVNQYGERLYTVQCGVSFNAYHYKPDQHNTTKQTESQAV